MSSWIPRLSALVAVAVLAVVAIYTLDRDNPVELVAMDDNRATIEELEVEVIARYPHARDAFTQGLLWHGGMLYESTGQRGQSSLRQVELATGQSQRRIELDPTLFGEGLALVEDRLIQLTWTAGKALVYRRSDFQQIAEFDYQGQGWGLCYDGRQLYMSDGSSELSIRDPDSFAEKGRLQVTIRGRPQARLNELECAGGQIYANVWEYEQILRIDPQSGRVTAIIEATGLLDPGERRRVDVLNGIAHAPERDSFFLTGKYWPTLFEVRFKPAP
jgi:glutaminyl-peptide cyclotransferase